ncbi:hypothetical protein Q8W71_19395 [Methylobacterium sp. NEAU 140]|uniref:hypothetical protein n=1 Tax=Methylobacterium sp. NEAU 140 TaxID=3064945 RepID=UPI002736EEE5|nr:hypothetical protein [Methylobacterium sp. NEAU 140]MDP4024799.1 hypothetical protein [Methylobacterium sp. NEAU 140]
MDSLDRRRGGTSAAEDAEAQRRRDAAALWSALRAERRSGDERIARLRAMLLAAGDDAAA